MSAICALLWLVIIIEYLLLTNRYDDMKLFGLVLVCSATMFWLCNGNNSRNVLTPSGIVSTILLAMFLLYISHNRMKLFLKLTLIIILLTINNV